MTWQEDSVLLWKMICSNKMLANVELVLFLNKCDILDRKLKSGIRLAKYVRSFQDRPNDSETVQKCTCFMAGQFVNQRISIYSNNQSSPSLFYKTSEQSLQRFNASTRPAHENSTGFARL